MYAGWPIGDGSWYIIRNPNQVCTANLEVRTITGNSIRPLQLPGLNAPPPLTHEPILLLPERAASLPNNAPHSTSEIPALVSSPSKPRYFRISQDRYWPRKPEPHPLHPACGLPRRGRAITQLEDVATRREIANTILNHLRPQDPQLNFVLTYSSTSKYSLRFAAAPLPQPRSKTSEAHTCFFPRNPCSLHPAFPWRRSAA